MNRVIPVVVVSLVVAISQASALSAAETQKRAYKASERQRQAAQAPDTAEYEKELQAAQEQRDKELADAAAGDSDRRTLEKRKQEIFAKYAKIVAALRDKYEAANPDDTATAQPKAGKRKVGRQKDAEPDPNADDTAAAGKNKGRNKKGRDSAGALAAAQEKLDEENTRHQAKLDQLNAQLQQAEASGNQRALGRAQKAVEKENNTHNARRALLERRVQELGGTVAPAVDNSPNPGS